MTSWFILSVLFLAGGEMSLVPLDVLIPHYTDLHPSRNVYQTSWFILSVLFLKDGRHLWSLDLSRFPCHTDLHPSRNINPTSRFIQSVLFLTGGEMSLVPTCIRDSPSHGPPPW